jgi:hypothetical protein
MNGIKPRAGFVEKELAFERGLGGLANWRVVQIEPDIDATEGLVRGIQLNHP